MPRLYFGTKKGLFVLDRDGAGDWKVVGTGFLGDPVPMLLPERDGVTVRVGRDL